jgi:transcriptional regulator with XRE-family HTH domain
MAGAETDTHQYLRAWRKRRNKTLRQVSELVGSKVNTISGWETGNRRVNLDDLARLAVIYEATPDDLLRSPKT